MDEHDDFWRQNFVYKFIVVKCMNNSKNMEARHILSSGYGNFRVNSHLSTTKLYFILMFVVLNIDNSGLRV